jgi:hypothetical protein
VLDNDQAAEDWIKTFHLKMCIARPGRGLLLGGEKSPLASHGRREGPLLRHQPSGPPPEGCSRDRGRPHDLIRRPLGLGVETAEAVRPCGGGGVLDGRQLFHEGGVESVLGGTPRRGQ